MKRIIITAAIMLAAAGCGGGSGLPTDATGAPKLAAVAESIGCKNLKPFKPTLYASAEGNCKLDGRTVDLATFATDKLQHNWEQVAGNFSAKIKDGPGWAAYQG